MNRFHQICINDTQLNQTETKSKVTANENKDKVTTNEFNKLGLKYSVVY